MKLFAELSEELEREGLRGHVYIVGGAAMIAGYGRQRSTHDVDGKIVSEKRGITEAAQRIAEKHDLPANWLNENATLFIPHKEDSQAATVFNSPNLVVTGASPRHLLAMKIDAGRPEEQVGTWKRSRGSSPSRTPGSSTVNLRSRSRNARSRRAASFRRFVRAAPDLAASARSSSAAIAVFSASHSISNGRTPPARPAA